MNVLKAVLVALLFVSCENDESNIPAEQMEEFTMGSFDGNLSAPFGNLPYRVYYPVEEMAKGMIGGLYYPMQKIWCRRVMLSFK